MLPRDSFFLFGPRGTGKTWLLRAHFGDACWFDLLDQRELLRIHQSPAYFEEAVCARPRDQWVVVDEIQRAPQLLDVAHRLIEMRGQRFVLTGSSARKLKRGAANLLAGRAILRNLFPLTFAEYRGHASLDDVLSFGSLPGVLLDPDRERRVDRLTAYASMYLAEEIKAEALTRNLGAFSRVLTVAALATGQVTNLANVARESGVSRSTVSSYFSILEDTLIGAFLPAWQPRVRMKEVQHAKFYLFDCGVYRALIDRVRDAPSAQEKGVLFETCVFHELRAAVAYRNVGGTLSYWRTHDGTEVDFVWQRGKRVVGIEAKASDSWRPEYGRGLEALGARVKGKFLGVYRGERELKTSHYRVLPVETFLARLARGDFFQ